MNKALRRLGDQRLVLVLSGALSLIATQVHAAVYGGTGITPAPINGLNTSTDVTPVIISIITFMLDIVLVLAVAAVIIAGIYLIVSGGDEGQKDKAKNIILYVIIGIVVILFARVIVTFVNNIF